MTEFTALPTSNMEETEKDSPPVSLLQLDAPSAVAGAMQQLCTLKVQMDRFSRDPIGQPFLDDWMQSHNTCAYFGHSLVKLILPFAEWEQSEGKECYRAYVDPRSVLGACINGSPGGVSEEEVSDKIKKYSTVFGTEERDACYIWYKELGLFCAHEGKHRVAFMRAHDQQAIAAWVREASYPESERLSIIKPSDERDEWLALLDGRYLQVLKRPRVSRYLLDAYGVKTVRWEDMSTELEESLVRQEIYQRKLHRPQRTTSEDERTLDLDELKQIYDQELSEKVTTVSVSDLDSEHAHASLKLDWKRCLIIIFGAIFLSIIFLIIGYEIARYIGFAFLGIAVGFIVALENIRFRGLRKGRSRHRKPLPLR